MSLWDKLISFVKPNNDSKAAQKAYPLEYTRLLELRDKIDVLINLDRYVSRREYTSEMEKYAKTIKHFKVLVSDDLIEDYCKKHGIIQNEITDIIGDYENIELLIKIHNDGFIDETMVSEKQYLDDILKDIDPQISLDYEQRKVVLTDEDNCLVIAGAGAGKTTTVAAKVKYLVERQNIAPEQILVISFTNKAVNELKDRINVELKIPCPIATFHSTGNAVLHRQSTEKLNIVQAERLYYCTLDYFRNNVLQNKEMVDKLVLFFASYFDAPFEGKDINEFFEKISKANYSTLKSDLNEIKESIIDKCTKKCVTIQNEVLRSYQEVEIANFLYLHNINYKYEPVYKYNIVLSQKPYTPDFILTQGDKSVYLEHFGISESGQNNLYNSDQLEMYKKAVNDKVRLHRQHNTRLIYTFSAYNDGRPLTEHLKELLENEGFVLNPRSNREIFEKIIANEENRYIRRLVELVSRFIRNFKTNGYSSEKFTEMYNFTQNVRSKLFLSICHECYLNYQKWLKANQAIDFEDMINESAKILLASKEHKLDFKYIIVDEYQDISMQRFDLTRALSQATNAKIIAVGDDWQSIYAFSGSDITLFTGFQESVGYAEQMIIRNTYRNSQEVIDIAGGFIQKNTTQISKRLNSPKQISDPVIIYTYDTTYKKAGQNNRSGANFALAKAIEVAISQIEKYDKTERGGNKSKILLLGRFNFDGERLEKSGLYEFYNRGSKIRSIKYPDYDITFMTAHASKGLGYDNVIIVNGRNETYGFPSKIEDDPVLSFVIRNDRSIEYAEERRLFYVAMTRTKNRVFFVAPEQNPSEFLLEIKKDYKNVVLNGEWNDDAPFAYAKKKCPICGYPLRLRYKNSYGLRLFICSNEPELCGFMTNKIEGGKLSIMKCPDCTDGYLIVKNARERECFLGCTNYKKNNTGCNHVIWKNQYYKMMGYEADKTVNKETDTELQTKPQQSKPAKSSSKNIVEKMYPESIKKYENPKLSQELSDLNDIIYNILMCLNHISEERFRNKEVFLNVLRGIQQDKPHNDLNSIQDFGILSNISREILSYIVDWLINKNFIRQTKGRYPVLHPSINGLSYSQFIDKKMLAKLNKTIKTNNIGVK